MSIFTVTALRDRGAGSLREAIAQAQSGDTIRFSKSLAGKTLTLTSGQIELTKNLIIDGKRAPGLTLSGGDRSRIFDMTGIGNSLTLRNLTLADGFDAAEGGALRTGMDSRVTIQNVNFENNRSGFGGAIKGGFRAITTVVGSRFRNNDGTLTNSERGGGAIATDSLNQLTVHGSTFSNNRGINGGAINTVLSQLTIENSRFVGNDTTAGRNKARTSGYGGAVYTDGASNNRTPDSGTILIRGSHFEDNTAAGQGGGLFLYAYAPDQVIVEDSNIINNTVIPNVIGDSLGGGLRHGNASLSLRNTTLANNRAFGQGGGLWIGETSPVAIANSTFSGNIADDGKGGGVGAALLLANQSSSPVTIDHSTFAYNKAGFMGGAFFTGEQSVVLSNSIVAYNTGDNPWNLQEQTNRRLTNGGGNIQVPGPFTNDPQDVTVTANILIADPNLAPLRDNGMGLLTHALKAGSPAIDRAKRSSLETDQRGIQRDNVADAGAIEFVRGALKFVGTNQSDTLSGSRGKDKLIGKDGNDTLLGQRGNDKLKGGNSKDWLYGNGGNDKLIGQRGNDVLVGGKGKDLLVGGKGKDRYTFEAMGDGVDVIRGFELRKDRLDIGDIFDGDAPRRRVFFKDYLELAQRGSRTVVSVDLDGDRPSQALKSLVVLQGINATDLSARDFIL